MCNFWLPLLDYKPLNLRGWNTNLLSMFYVSSVLNQAVSLEVSHVVAGARWQLGLESSEVTVNAGCQQGTGWAIN